MSHFSIVLIDCRIAHIQFGDSAIQGESRNRHVLLLHFKRCLRDMETVKVGVSRLGGLPDWPLDKTGPYEKNRARHILAC